MGVLWTVWPIDTQMEAWLDEQGIAHPDACSRFPTGCEIKAVLSKLQDFNVEIRDNGIGGSWQAWITSALGGESAEWTLLNISEYSGDPEEQRLWFEKGSESLIRRVIGELAKSTGPLVLIDDASGQPQVIV